MEVTESRVAIRVRYNECDPMGYLHHAAYVPYFEIGRVELLRANGHCYKDLEAAGTLFVVVKLQVSFKRPARYDDQLEVITRVERQTHVRIDHAYELKNQTTGELLCTAQTSIACVDREGQLQAIPENLGGKWQPAASAS